MAESGLQLLDDSQLVSLLKEGQVSAFEEIYRRYWYKLYCMAFHRTGHREEAEELVQDVYMSLWHRRSVVVIRHLELYLTLAIKNQVYDYIKSQVNYRKYQEYLILQEIYQSQATEEVVNYGDLNEAIQKALARLPEKSAAIFRLSRFDQQSVKEIADNMHMSEKAVEYHITKSLKFLKDHLQAYLSDN